LEEFILRTQTEQAAKNVLDIFLMPDQFEHPLRRRAADGLARFYSDLAVEDKVSLHNAMNTHPELGAMFAQSVIAKNRDSIKFPEVRKFVINEIPNVKDSSDQAVLLSQVTREELTREQASFVVKNVLDYFENQIKNVPESTRFSNPGDLDQRFFALQRTSEFHTDADKLKLAEMARTDDAIDGLLETMNARVSSMEGRQNAPEGHIRNVDDPHSGDDRDRGNLEPSRHYDPRSRDDHSLSR
jgi:hypothetical protein